MATALPNGLVSHTNRASSELRRFDSVDTEDIAKLWRVYTTNTTTLKQDTGRRLENLFWRIWSNNRICTGIRGSTVARLLLHISEGVPVAPDWTTRNSGRGRGNDADTDASVSHEGFGNFSFGKKTLPLSSRSPLSPEHASGTSPRNTALNPRGKQALRPPPILKKPRETFCGQRRDGGFLIPEASGHKNTLRDGTVGDKSAPDSSPLAATNNSNSPGRKRTTFAKNLVSSIDNQTGLQRLASVSTGGAKAKALAGVQTETQAETIQSKKGKAPHRQQHPDPSHRNQQNFVPSPLELPRTSTSSSTSSSRTLAHKSPTQHYPPKPSGPALVDKDFRSKFVAKQRISGASAGLGASMITYFNSPTDINPHARTLTSTSPHPPPPSTFQIPPSLTRRTSSPGNQSRSYRSGARSPSQSSTFFSSMPLPRSSSVQTISRRPVQGQLSRLLELEREREEGRGEGSQPPR